MNAPAEYAPAPDSGFDLTRALTGRQVGEVKAIFRRVVRRHGCPPLTLFAIGGTGLGMQSPRSDIDLGLIHPDQPDPRTLSIVESATADFVGELYDCRMAIGSRSLFSLGEVRQCSQHDFRLLSALLCARYIAGNRCLVDAFERTRDALLAAGRDDFLAWLVADRSRRHRLAAEGSRPDEPNLKNSPGGLRDAQQVLWVARALGHPTLAGAVRAGLLRREQARLFRRALGELLHLRYVLHSVNAMRWRPDVLYRDSQDAAANWMGIAGGRVELLSIWKEMAVVIGSTAHAIEQGLVNRGKEIRATNPRQPER